MSVHLLLQCVREWLKCLPGPRAGVGRGGPSGQREENGRSDVPGGERGPAGVLPLERAPSGTRLEQHQWQEVPRLGDPPRPAGSTLPPCDPNKGAWVWFNSTSLYFLNGTVQRFGGTSGSCSHVLDMSLFFKSI